jgi:basic membrane lipoprotein Med (substrate-binding protein (PBP1-ABC) superfamily)
MSKRVRSRNAAQPGPPSTRPRQFAVAALALILGAVAAWAFWPDPRPRQREYLDATACLLTDEKGVTGKDAAPIWSAMQDASVSSLVRVQYLPVNGPQTADNARAYVASLAGGKCGVVIAVGTAQVDAVTATAQTFPAARFVTVGGGTPSANVSVVEASDAATAIGQRVSALADENS